MPEPTKRMTEDQLRRLDAGARKNVRDHFRDVVPDRARARQRHRRYYDDLYGLIRSQVPPGSKVLDLGCGDGALLDSLRPSYGVGVDVSLEAVREAKRQYPHLHFVCADVELLPVVRRFDYVIASNVVGFLIDVQTFLRSLTRVVHPSSRIVIAYHNFAWRPILWLAELVGLKSREPLQSWLSVHDLENLLQLEGFEPVKAGYRTPVPVGSAAVAGFMNTILSAVPLINRLGLISFVTARPLNIHLAQRIKDPTCTIVIPTRNERGNVRAAVERFPDLGRHTEVIFVEGHSTDGTADEVRSVIRERPDLDLKLVVQSGRGKGDAVRTGFEAATGDVLMILDGDLTVPPEELSKFWRALVEEKGEFINGSRLVYPLEDDSMRIANLAGNKLFSLIFTWILGERVTDTLCGTKVLWARDYERIAANRASFGDFDPFGDFDLLFGAAKLGLKIREIPVRYRPRTYGTTNIDRWRHGVLLARMAWIGARKLRFP